MVSIGEGGGCVYSLAGGLSEAVIVPVRWRRGEHPFGAHLRVPFRAVVLLEGAFAGRGVAFGGDGGASEAAEGLARRSLHVLVKVLVGVFN